MLDYENQMFLEILQDDGLVVCAKGLGLETVFISILKVYCDPGNLVIVLGTNEHDEEYFMDQLKKQSINKLPQTINAQCLSDDRKSTYLEGGVLFISGRILVVDLLKDRVPLNLVTGILVYRAHNINNSYQEAFALRLYRQQNKTGFIKAFTNSALAFMSGFGQVERVMKTLFVKKLYLWPRFHSTVNNSLSQHKPEVIELHAKLTPKMVKIQTGLLDVINMLVKDLKRLNKYLDLEELTVENVVSKKFHKHLQSQLDPVWDQLSFKTKQIIADMKTLRYMLMCLTHQDAVTFYSKLNGLRTVEYAMKSSGWMMLDVVEDIFKYAKSRIYTDNNDVHPEPNPKWTALSEILIEIHRNFSKDEDPEKVQKVLILTQDSATCNQLKNVLTVGSENYLIFKIGKQLNSVPTTNPNKIIESTEKSDTEEKSEHEEDNETTEMDTDQESYILTLSQAVPDKDDNEKCNESLTPVYQNYFEDCSQMENMDLTTIATCDPILVIQSLKKNGNPMSLQKTLSELNPKYIIMYVADITAVRQLEVYQNNNPNVELKIYFLIYGGSVEEQAYLTSLRQEKEAFDRLINTKSTMVIPIEQDGKLDIPNENASAPEDPQQSRKGDQQEQVKHKIIVDMREFRSELPSLLHKRYIDVEPVTLIIGDYILSPELCVERKSISDLIGSLNSGRLYNQAVAMTRYYAKPILLIEFDENKPFNLQGNYYISKDMRSIDVTAKLQLLTMHFPKLRIVWSPSPSATAQLFEELKQGRAQPDGTKCAQIGTYEDSDDNKVMTEKYNTSIQDFVIKLPGVNSKNLHTVMNKGVSLDKLIKLSQDEIKELVGNKNDAQLLHRALHEKLKATQETGPGAPGKFAPKSKQRKLFTKSKSSK